MTYGPEAITFSEDCSQRAMERMESETSEKQEWQMNR